MNHKINHYLLETFKHIKKVRYFLNIFAVDIINRGQVHDDSKFEDQEKNITYEFTYDTKNIVYGSEEYKKLMEKIQPAIKHHHSKNRHHPEHFPNGIDDMTLIDLIEMIADWKASTEKNKDGCIYRSIDINSEKYNMSPQLRKIFINTVNEYFKEQ